MDTVRLFQSGRSQAVRLLKDYRFSGREVVVKHFGNGVLLLPIDDPWHAMEAGLAAFEPGFELHSATSRISRRARPSSPICRQVQSSHDPAGHQHLH